MRAVSRLMRTSRGSESASPPREHGTAEGMLRGVGVGCGVQGAEGDSHAGAGKIRFAGPRVVLMIVGAMMSGAMPLRMPGRMACRVMRFGRHAFGSGASSRRGCQPRQTKRRASAGTGDDECFSRAVCRPGLSRRKKAECRYRSCHFRTWTLAHPKSTEQCGARNPCDAPAREPIGSSIHHGGEHALRQGVSLLLTPWFGCTP